MKKILLPLVTLLVVAFALVSCGGKGTKALSKTTPVDQLIEKLSEFMKYSDMIDQANDPSDIPLATLTEMMTKVNEMKEFADANKDYVLSDKDREKLKNFMKENAEKLDVTLSEEDLNGVDEFKTLGDILAEMDFDDF